MVSKQCPQLHGKVLFLDFCLLKDLKCRIEAQLCLDWDYQRPLGIGSHICILTVDLKLTRASICNSSHRRSMRFVIAYDKTLEFEPQHYWGSKVHDHVSCSKWTNYRTSLSLRFHICEMWYVTVSHRVNIMVRNS